MVEAADRRFMERALLLAERGRGRTSPNPIVGSVVVSSDGVVVGQGAHLKAGDRHAEIVALDAAGPRARGSTLYSTLEPCSHVGRTGACVERIAAEGVARVVMATRDPNPRVSGSGVSFLRRRGVLVTEDICRPAADRLNAAYFTWVTGRRPFVILKTAVSADGFVGDGRGGLRLTGAAADRFLHRERAAIDALAVGSGTVIADDPLLTARVAYRFRPLIRVIFDWRARIPASARVWSTLEAGPVIMVVTDEAVERHPAAVLDLERRGIEILRRPDRALAPVLGALGARDIVTLVVEGGPALHEVFWRAGLSDRVQWIATPRALGRGVRVAPSLESDWRARRPSGRRLGDDELVEWDVHGPDRSDRTR
jgi:diaminohydroxyphosphoribosylaminopyrimidine deaminase/5-amino-6-(5-phosphoribosylamino)uracil reductase